jgi:hypothetical protein
VRNIAGGVGLLVKDTFEVLPRVVIHFFLLGGEVVPTVSMLDEMMVTILDSASEESSMVGIV